MADFLNECKITPPDCSPDIPQLGNEDDTVLQQILLEFMLIDYGMEKKRFIGKMNLRTVDYSINDNSKELVEKWKVIKFDHLSKGAPHVIKRAIE